MIDAPGAAALGVVLAEWLALGWLSGLGWPGRLAAPWGPRWALRLLVGAFLMGVALLLAALAGVSLHQLPLLLALAAGLALGLRWAAPWAGATTPARPAPAGRRERAGWLLLGWLLAAAALRAWLVPEAGWDAYSHWGLKAKAYFLAGGIVATRTAHEYYPPLVPLLESWLYLHRGAALIDQGKLIWAPLGAAFATCLTWHLRLAIRPTWLAPLLGAGIVLGSVQLLESFWTGQADLALTAFLSLSALALFEWRRASGREGRAWLLQAALFAGAASLAKHEGLFRVGVVAAALLGEAAVSRAGARRHLGAALAYSAVAIACFAPWALFRSVHQIEVTAEHLGRIQWEAAGAVLRALAASLGGVRTGGGLVVALLAVALGGRQALAPPARLLGLIVLGELAATLGAFLATGSSPELEVRLSATRLFMQFTPLALFVGALGLARALRAGPAAAAAGPEGSAGSRDLEPAAV